MSNIPGLNEEESEWVCNFLKACCNHGTFSEKPPSDKALDHMSDIMEDIEKKRALLN